MQRSRFLVTGMLVLFAMLGLTSGAAAAPVDDLVAAARKEGVINFLAPSTLTPPGAETLGQAFNKKYGLNIQLNYIPSGAMPRNVANVISQTAAGMAPECDVLVVMDAHHASLWLRKLHQTFDYAKLGVDPKMIHYDGGTVAFANQFIFPAYNKKTLLPQDVPKRWEDLLDPKWKGGKLGMSNATIHLAMLASGSWGEKRTTEYVKALAKQDLNLGTLGELYTRLQVGEILVAVTMTDSFIHRAKETGAPIVHAERIEPLISPAYNAGVPKGAPHPSMGRLFVAFLIIFQAQEIWEQLNPLASSLHEFKNPLA